MPPANASAAIRPRRPAFEFWLVIVLLAVLTILVVAILAWPITVPDKDQQVTGKEVTLRDVLEHRVTLLSLVITAFGAWVGAGAAYFFGRENLRVAADSLLAMHDASPRERLRRTPVQQLPPRPLTWAVKASDPIQAVKDKLEAEPELWFVPVVKADGTLETVINEEGVLRYLLTVPSPPAAAPKTVKDLLDFLNDPARKRFRDVHVSVTPDTTVSAANDLMESKGTALAIVETDGKPTHFLTTGDVRKLMLREV